MKAHLMMLQKVGYKFSNCVIEAKDERWNLAKQS